MELTHALTWEGFTMDTRYDALRGKVREKTRKEKNRDRGP